MSPQQNPRPGAGDLTGRQKAQVSAEQATVQKQRDAEVSMASAARAQEDEVGIFDGQSGQRVDVPEVEVVAPEPHRFGPRSVEEEVYTGKESPEEVQQAIVSNQQRTFAPRVESAFVTIRVDQDVEDMTYGIVGGRPNNFTFLEGRAYRVPRDVYEHLDTLGLIRQVVAAR